MNTVRVYVASMLLIQTLCLPSVLFDYIRKISSNETCKDENFAASSLLPSLENIENEIHQKYPKRNILNTSDFVDVQCNGVGLEKMGISKHVVRPTKLKLSACILSQIDFLALELRAMKIDVTKVTDLELNDLNAFEELKSTLFDKLNLTSITISFKIRDIRYRPIFKLIDVLTNVTEFKLKNYRLLPLPPSQIKIMTLINVEMVEYDFGDCKELIKLNLTDCDLKNIISLGKCLKLEVLTISGQSVTESVLDDKGHGVKNLKELAVHGSQLLIEFTKDEFKDAKLLKRLDLSGNRLLYIELENFPFLENLDVSRNLFHYRFGVVTNLMQAKRLLNATFDYNPGLDICEVDNTRIRTIAHKSLRRLSLAGTKTRSLCFHLLESLEYLDLRNCNITELNFGALPQSRAPLLEVDLRGSPVFTVSFGKDDYNRLRYVRDDPTRNASIKIHADIPPLDCDCENAYLALAQRGRTLNITNLRCIDGTAMEDTEARALECYKYNCQNCTCRRPWNDGWTVADCRELKLLSLPSIPNVHELQAGGNSIQKINVSSLINSNFTRLNLTDNKISTLEDVMVEALFAGNRLLWLAGNPIMCDCDNRPMIEGLQAHSTQVKDYPSVLCVGTGQPVRNVSVGALCAGRRGELWPALVGGGGTLVALAAFSSALYLRYRRTLEMFLYARGWCLCCVREDQLDADRIYDAFVSFSHDDEAFVVEELVAGLESAREYRLGVHFRDWTVGEWIPEQIARSIEQSRRTIIVLSKSYLESMWGLLEFRMAHASAMEEGRARIIVVVLDEVVEDERLDAELRGYLRTNTYVRWGDRWFWEKLQYAMPRGALRGRERIIDNLPDNFEMIPAS